MDNSVFFCLPFFFSNRNFELSKYKFHSNIFKLDPQSEPEPEETPEWADDAMDDFLSAKTIGN